VIFGATAPTGIRSGVQNYALFLLCGTLPWGFFALTTSLGMSALLSNAGLVRKAAFPRQTLIYAQAIFSLVQFSIEIVLLIVFSIVAGVSPSPMVLLLPIYMIILGIFSTGIALGLSVVLVYFRDVNYLWTIFLQIFFFVTPIFWAPTLIESRASPLVINLIEWNPMNQFVQVFRSILYDSKLPSLLGTAVITVCAFIFFICGNLLFTKLNRRIAEEL